MKSLTMNGEVLYHLWASLPTLDPEAWVSTDLVVKLRRLRGAVGEYYQPFDEQLSRLIAKHTDGASRIPADHPNRTAFDEEAAPLWAEEFTIEIEPIPLDLIECKAVLVTEPGLDALLTLGVVVEG